MPSKPRRKPPPQRYYLVEVLDKDGWFTIHQGRHLRVAKHYARFHNDARITAYERIPSKRRSKR